MAASVELKACVQYWIEKENSHVKINGKILS